MQLGYLLAVFIYEHRLRIRARPDGIQHVEVLRDEQQVDDVLRRGALDLLVAREVADRVLEAVHNSLALPRDAEGIFSRGSRDAAAARSRLRSVARDLFLRAWSRGLQKRLLMAPRCPARARVSKL